jgi:DUF1365 family protein
VESCLYEGVVRHRRLRPVAHAFAKRLCLFYLDLDELPRVFRGRWLASATRPAPIRFRREDYFGDPAVPLAQAVRDLVEARTGRRPAGPIRLLTSLRTFGFGFNPVSFVYCFDPAGERVEFVVAEVTSTPWKERHAYVLEATGAGAVQRFEAAKQLHVSPFMGMRQTYRFAFGRPGERLAVGIANVEDGAALFHASLVLRRREISSGSLARALVRYPWMPAQVIAAIYWQALRLRRKGAPVHPHPGRPAAPRGAPAPARAARA